MLFELWDGKRNGLAKNLHSRKSFWNCTTLGIFSYLWNYWSSNIFLMHSFLKTDFPDCIAPTFHRKRDKLSQGNWNFTNCDQSCDAVTQRHLLIFILFLPWNAEKLPSHIRIPLWEALCKHRATRVLLAQRKYSLGWGQETMYSYRQNIQCNSLIWKMDRGFCTTYIFSSHNSQEQF